MRSTPSQSVVKWIRSWPAGEIYTTSITVAEVRHGIERLPDGRRKDLLWTTAEEVFAGYAERVLPFDAGAATRYTKVVNKRERAGLPIDGFDAQIAAICSSRDAALATRNVKDFHDTGIELLDPWHPIN